MRDRLPATGRDYRHVRAAKTRLPVRRGGESRKADQGDATLAWLTRREIIAPEQTGFTP
jgi:hypothetical protein